MSLRLAAASVERGGARLLDEVSITVEGGRVTALLGPNGAGKSTALGVLAGDSAPCRGEASLDGRPMSDFSPTALARRRAVVPQSARPAFAFRVDEYVALGQMPFGPATLTDVQSRVAAALADAGCSALHSRDIGTLSGGEFQRVQFARALAQLAPCVDGATTYLLLDEPTSALDLAHQAALLRKLRALARRGHGVLAVLHDLNLALHVADAMVVLDGGRVAGAGPPEEVLTEELIESVWEVPVRLVRDGAGRPATVVPAPESMARC